MQNTFKLDLPKREDVDNFLISSANIDAYQAVIKKDNWQKLLIIGPSKSGKSSLCKLWQEKNDALFLKELPEVSKVDLNHNIIVDQLEDYSEIDVVNAINIVSEKSLRILLTASAFPSATLQDLKSRLQVIYKVMIKHPDEELLRLLIMKLFHERQLLIPKEIIETILNYVERDYESLFAVVENIDNYSKIHKKKITSNVIKEILE